jgi:hypothetical protein
MATYLTYLYIPDASSGQIYRYPRVEGGFGEKTNWLKDTQQLKEISGLTIDDSVYLTTGDAILKFFKGEKQNTSFENSQTPISFDNIYTSTESSFIYILDKKNTRLIQYNKNGEIIRQHFLGKNLQNITAFTVDSHDEKAYLVSEKNLLTVSL